MPKPRAQYVDTRTLIDGPPILSEIAVIPTPGADSLIVYDFSTKEYTAAELGTGLSLGGGAIESEAPVTSVNTQIGDVVLDADDISDAATTNKWNVTHTGEVTGATTLTVDKTAIGNRTLVTLAPTDLVLISQTSDGGNLKKVVASDFGGGGGLSQPQVMARTLGC